MACTTLTACEDYLSVDSPSQFDADYLFSSTDDTKKVLLGAYSKFGEDPYSSRMSNVWNQNTDVEASQPSSSPDGTRRDIWSLQTSLLANFSDVYKAWVNNYEAIDRCNQVIEGIQNSDIADDDDMKHMLGEAYCLRAWRYLMLVNYWADVPYYTAASAVGQDLDKPRTDKNTILSGELQYLVDNEENMYFCSSFSDGIERMNRDFALGLIAKMALFRAGYGMTYSGIMKRADDYLSDLPSVTYTYNGVQKTATSSSDYYQMARDYCEKLMTLQPRELEDYEQMFENQNNRVTVSGTSEILYEVAFAESYGGDVGWCIGQTVSSSSNGTTTIQVLLSPSYYFMFDSCDVRRNVTVTKEAIESTGEVAAGITSLAVNKWSRARCSKDLGSSSSKGTGINWPLMRYSDVLLMYAEAENELNGPTSSAKEALLKVRQRAFAGQPNETEMTTTYVNSLSSKDAFFDAIVDERALEFGGECIRKWDLVRWNLYAEKVLLTRERLYRLGLATDDAIYQQNTADLEYYRQFAPILYYQTISSVMVYYNEMSRVDNADILNNEVADHTQYKFTQSLKSSKYIYEYASDGETKVDSVKVTYPASYITRCYRGYTVDTRTEDEITADEMSNQSLYGTGHPFYDCYSKYGGDHETYRTLKAVPYVFPIGYTTLTASETLSNDGYLLDTTY